jgi:Methane oxygenase PmoA
MLRFALPLLLFALPASAAEITIAKTDTDLEFKAGDALVAKYRYAGTVRVEKGDGTKPLAKPFFHPLNAPDGTCVTRHWPMVRDVKGETTDHFHQKSAWFCHGDVIPEGIDLKKKSSDTRVHGVDFWAETAGHGRIVCVDVGAAKGATIVTRNEWRTPDETNILDETRTLSARALSSGTLIVLDIDLHASVCPITFGDTKEGSMGVRVSDEIQNKTGNGVVTSVDGSSAKAPAKDNLPMWGKFAAWHDYSGTVGGKPVGVAIFDDPKNAQPAAWHTRAYGLMAANPFGRNGSQFPALKGKTDLVKLAKGEHLKLRYGIYVHTGDAATGKVPDAFAVFAK